MACPCGCDSCLDGRVRILARLDAVEVAPHVRRCPVFEVLFFQYGVLIALHFLVENSHARAGDLQRPLSAAKLESSVVDRRSASALAAGTGQRFSGRAMVCPLCGVEKYSHEIRDLTAARHQQLRQQEAKIRAAVETMPAVAFITLQNGERTFVNKRRVEYSGLAGGTRARRGLAEYRSSRRCEPGSGKVAVCAGFRTRA
jgi:PAS domain-containing protein